MQLIVLDVHHFIILWGAKIIQVEHLWLSSRIYLKKIVWLCVCECDCREQLES